MFALALIRADANMITNILHMSLGVSPCDLWPPLMGEKKGSFSDDTFIRLDELLFLSSYNEIQL